MIRKGGSIHNGAQETSHYLGLRKDAKVVLRRTCEAPYNMALYLRSPLSCNELTMYQDRSNNIGVPSMKVTFLAIACAAFAASAVEDTILLPAPKGKYAIDIKVVELIDHGRKDPFDPNGGPRKLMVSVIFPTIPTEECIYPEAFPYAPDRTAELLGPVLESYGWPDATPYIKRLRLPVCPTKRNPWTSPWQRKESFPVVLFSHGLGGVRLASSSQAQAVASNGFVVITIDHPYDAAVVEYTDGSIVLARNFTTNEELDQDVQVRAQDASFILDDLERADSVLRAASRMCGPDEKLKVGMFGHSLGGATSMRAVYYDERIAGAIDLDGVAYGFNTTGPSGMPVFSLPKIQRPFMLFNEPAFLTEQPFAQEFQTLYDSFTGWKRRLSLDNSGHLTFTDLPLLVDSFALRSTLPAAFETSIGTIEGLVARDTVAAYVSAFMAKYLKGEDSTLLKGPNDAYPEVKFVSMSG
ncbi:hypothetical protein PRZ48_014850 [Zasmidium cellare]|uniref:1-alkyl-2-acetylglycerophosphocholine esterase n=1 Tax=Zasmidium cellare TaxID=395010 RepID=A0ABR0DWV9_ZASCE|nr:hypothetical protein PRZ48_014850 [Zasmidium cellare]